MRGREDANSAPPTDRPARRGRQNDDQGRPVMLRPFRQGTSDSSPPASRARGWRALLAGLPAVMALAALLFALPAAAAAPSPVFRFYNTATGTHFYTISVSERDAVIARYPTFTYEGPTFWALTTPDATTRPVYRFFNVRTGTHFYTISETEKNFVIANYPTFIFEGAVYYAMPGATSTTTGLYRFYNTRTGAHFYTISTAERDYVVAHWPFFTLEGVVYYVMPTGNGIPVNPPVNVAPQATIVASASQIGVPGAVTLTVTATDADGVVMNVALFDNGNEVAAFSAPPYVYTYTATAAGDHMFTAVATDDKGATGTSSGVAVKAGSAAANVAPTATLIASLSTLTVGSPVTLTANAAESDGAVTKVDFYLGATKINTATAPVGAASFGPTYVYTPAAAGTYTFTAVATDDKGATATSKPANVTVNAAGNKPPTVSVGLSSSFVIVPGTVTLTASASDPDGTVTKVSFFQDGVKLVDIVPPATLTKTVTLTTAGTYNFTAQATDNLGAVTMSTQAPVAAQNPPVVAAADADIWRLLNQATFGATQPEAARAKAMGIPAWLDDQFAQPVSGYPDSKYNRIQLKTTPDCTTTMPDGKTSYPPSSPEAMCVRDHLTLAMLQRDFFTHAVSGADQLRQRVAWALSQIVVTSANEQDLSYAHVMSRYQSIMFEEAFGNFEALLNKVTVNPAMGNYLDAVNNDRPNGTRVPNENYAREIMQLFSIGLVELGADGTPLKDAQGNLIPTYDQDDIKEFARVFTGWTYADPTGVAPTKKNAPYYGAPMQPFPTTATSGHDTTAKTLLNGQQLLANQTIQADTQAAVHNVFMHPNTGPFVAKQLIQHLVTGNPTPAYVKRVADVFANNGSGVRGDLKAVVRAILTDTEARGATKADPTFGALREPVQVVTSLIRALSGFTDGAGLEGRTNPLGQRPFFSPTVFNYYQPDYTIPGTSTLAPEFTIHNSNTAVGRANLVYSLVYNGIGPDATIPGATGTKVNTVQFAPLANDPLALVNQVNAVLLGGALPAAARDLIVTAVNAIPVNANPAVTQWKTDRANMAVYLMASSYHFQVQH
jgi:uncharacterized protein (DUF1800 family)